MIGDPLAAGAIRDRLNYLAKKYHIHDEQGNVFRFRLHAFRHTKAVELINNGMSLTLVQQWMAHVSPEMTLIYAKILDDTMRTAWEKTVQQGIVQFTDGKPELVAAHKLGPKEDPNTFDPQRVPEHRQNVKKAYLYSQTDLQERIEALRQQTMEQMVRERARPRQGKPMPVVTW